MGAPQYKEQMKNTRTYYPKSAIKKVRQYVDAPLIF